MPDSFDGDVSYGDAAAFKLITDGQEPRLLCVVGGCPSRPVHAAICRHCRAVEYVCQGHLAKSQDRYARLELSSMYGGRQMEFRMGCCNEPVSSFFGAMDLVTL